MRFFILIFFYVSIGYSQSCVKYLEIIKNNDSTCYLTEFGTNTLYNKEFDIMRFSTNIDTNILINELLLIKGDSCLSSKRIYFNQPSTISSRQDLIIPKNVSLQQEAIFIISFLYGGYEYAPSKVLIDKTNNHVVNNEKVIMQLFSYFEKWFIEVKKMGMCYMRIQKKGPLDETNYKWLNI